MFKEILGRAFPIIEEFAPTVATALASPAAGAATSLAINILSSAFGIKSHELSSLEHTILNHTAPAEPLSQLETDYAQVLTPKTETATTQPIQMLKPILPELGWKLPSKAEVNLKLEWNDNGN